MAQQARKTNELLEGKGKKAGSKNQKKKDANKTETKSESDKKKRKRVARKSRKSKDVDTTTDAAPTTNRENMSRRTQKPTGPSQAHRDKRMADGACLNCGQKGHFKADCPKLKTEDKKPAGGDRKSTRLNSSHVD